MRIGLLLRYLNEHYQLTLFRGVMKEARRSGIELVCIQGGLLPSKADAPRPENILFDLPAHAGLDGVLILSSAIVQRSSASAVLPVVANFRSVPCVSIGLRVEGLTSIIVRNRRSMQAIMDHLIAEHGYRSLLLLAGPHSHHDSAAREGVFRASVARYAVLHPEIRSWVEYGEFTDDVACAIVQEFIRAHPDVHPDVIVAANDNMAIGALNALRLQDDPRWLRCAVTGFDDIPEAAVEVPALTSVRQPLEEMGQSAVRTLVSMIRHDPVRKLYRIDTVPVIRESCGCARKVPVGPIGEPAGVQSPGSDRGTRQIELILRKNLQSERRLWAINDFGQNLIGELTLDGIVNRLRTSLNRMNVSVFYLLLFETESQHATRLPSHCRLVYGRKEGEEIMPGPVGVQMTLNDFFRIYPAMGEPAPAFCIHGLHSGNDQMGLIAYEAEDWAHAYMSAIAIPLSDAIKRMRILEERSHRAESLEREVEKRTGDLQKINLMLRKEVDRRKLAEVELRRHRSNLEGILDAMPIPVAVFLPDSSLIRYSNKAFANLAGREPGAGEALSTFMVVPEIGDEIETAFGTSGGTLRVLVHTAPIRFEGADCVIAGLLDLSRQKDLERDVLKISEFERRRFGLDLHDDICQRLAGISIFGKTISSRLAAPAEAALVEELSAMIGETLKLTRGYAHGLFPVELQDLGLATVLRELCEQTGKQTGLSCHFECGIQTEEISFTADQEIHLYRIAQEAVQNAVRHARPRSIIVRLARAEGFDELEIVDDGIGIAGKRSDPMDEGSLEGIGMRTMRYRASQLGSSLFVTETPRGGTTLRVTVPWTK
jgi:signal transduction histidine kinase/DNA-binding LacI/PurR family transcriptional regulator